MVEIVKAFVGKQLESGNFSLAIAGAIVVAALYSVSRTDAILDFLQRLRLRKLDALQSYAKHEQLSDRVRTRAAQELSRTIYTKITGIPGDHYFIERIDAIIEKSQGDIQSAQVRRARHFLKLISGKVVVKITMADRMERAFILTVGSFILGVGFWAFVTGMLANIPVSYRAVLILIGLGTTLFSSLIFREAQPMRIAQELHPLIEQLQSAQTPLPAPDDRSSTKAALPAGRPRKTSESQAKKSTFSP